MTVIFVYHEKQYYGAGNALLSLEQFHKKHNIPTVMLYLYEIQNLSVLNQYPNPTVVCNTIASYPLVEALSKTNIPTYWYIHEWIDNTYNWLQHFNPSVFHSNIKPIFVCNASFENYKQRIPYIKHHMIMYNGISQESLRVKVDEYKVNRPEHTVIAMIGSIENRKNQQSFIDNVFYCLEQPVTLLLVGRILKQLYIKPHLRKYITVIDHVHNALPYIMSADIIVSYSLNEVLPIHIIESFYCKKPVISTNVGGISEMIEDGVNGFLIQPNDSASCIQRINQLLNKEKREQLGENAYNTFLTKFESSVTLKLL
jgi:glycosyltransferase involved in cell wall biosynthesis